MNGVVFLGVAVVAAIVVAAFWMLQKEKSRRLRDLEKWQEQERLLRGEHAALEQTLRERTAAVRELCPTIPVFVQPSVLERWADPLLASTMSAAQAAQAAFFRFDLLQQHLSPIAARGLEPARLESLKDAAAGVLHRAALAREATWLPEAAPETGLQGPLWAWPILVQDEPAALLVLGAINAQPSEAMRERVSLFVAQAAVSYSAFELARELEHSYADLIQSLARAIAKRDLYTHDHSDRTRTLVQAVAAEIHLPASLVRYIEYGALLHDLGKIGIPDVILHKPDQLTPAEYEAMKEHPAIGFQILEPVNFLRPVASIVLYHQEWFNGDGYPEGLAGEEIPLGARLVSVIDAWDAMTSDRVYRKALPKSAAMTELRRQSGTQFDPKMVDAFLRVIDRLERQGVPTTEAATLHAQ